MVLDNTNRNLILNILETQGPQTISELSTALKVSRPTIYLHLDVLEKEGLITRSQDRKKKGAPVTINIKEKAVKKKDVQEILDFLRSIEKAGSMDALDLSKITRTKYPVFSRAYHEAMIRRLITKKIVLTKEGKKFLRENSN